MKAFLEKILISLSLTLLLFVSLFAGTTDAEGLFLIRVKGKAGFIDSDGRVVIRPLLEDAQAFENGMAPAKDNGKWGFIDRSGTFIIKPTFDEIRWSFSEGVTPVLIGEKWGY